MKYFISIIRIFTGIIFVISGLIKLNDPIGFSFKLEEYFSVQVFDLPLLIPYTLWLALLVCILEIMLGILLLLGLWKKFTIRALLAMTLFFGFLTFYSAYYNKVTDCGCFGDAIKFTPWQSFWKDMILMLFIIIILIYEKYINKIGDTKVLKITTGICLLLSLSLGYYVYNYLPIIDFRPYKISTNIPQGMIYPEDAAPAVYDYHWKFEKEGKEYTLTTRGDYPETDGKFISVDTEEIEKGYVPPIHDFSIEKDGENYTEDFMQEDELIIVISYNVNKANIKSFQKIKEVTDTVLATGRKVIGLTYTVPKAEEISAKYELNFPFYMCDETTLKTIIRSNPAVIVLKKGTIVKKLHYNDIDKLN